MKIKKVEIEAFRAYKSKLDGTYDFTNDKGEAANFVAIYAPNGFGKSSFYDAVEWAVTNRIKRLVNYKSEVKSTKTPDEGLKILRNKYVDETIDTTVVLSSNDGNVFERSLPNIRKTQNDMTLGNSENEYFRRAILSQDEIEGFLREEKPQDRYSKFMDNFGGDIETARKELTALINDNKTELTHLQKKHKFLQDELKQPTDLSIFELFNSVAAELNSLGENIALPDESLSSQTLHKLNASLVSRKHEVITSLNSYNQTLLTLSERLNKAPEIELYANNAEEQKRKLDKLLKGVSDAEKYKGLFDSYNKCIEDQKQANVRLNKLIEISENVEPFLQTELRLKEINKTKIELNDEYSRLNIELANFEKSSIELTNHLKANDERAKLLKNKIKSSGEVYKELTNNQKKLDLLRFKTTHKKAEIQLNKELQEKLTNEQSELAALNITSSFLLAGNMGVMYFEKDKIEQLAKCHTELNLLEVNIQALRATQKALREQMESQEKLISIGLDFLSLEPSHICPLCTTSHISQEELIRKVKSQNLLPELSKENSQRVSQFSMQQNELKAIIQEITLKAVESQAHQLSVIRSELHKVGAKIAETEHEKKTFEAECTSLEHRNIQLENSVWNLSHQELIIRSETELSQLNIKRLSLIKNQEGLAEKIQITTESLNKNRFEYGRIESEIQTKSHAHVYASALAYINENAISSLEISKHCEIKKQELEIAVQEYKTSSESLASQCNILKQEMMSDNTWIEFSHLKAEKEALQLSLINSQSEIDAFYQSLSNFVNIAPENTIEQIKRLITTKSNELQFRISKLEKLINNINLLLDLLHSFEPYIKHTSTQKELECLEKQLKKRKQVNDILEVERTIIIEKLEKLIYNFFFEDLINSIYKKIDPHPTFKKVEFKVNFEAEKPSLNILVSDSAGGMISPVLYFSSAQTNILSLSVFLANALHARDDEHNSIDVILIDDPIQSMDSINVLAMIDLLRSICLRFNKQLIISTHDENFFRLLQRKIPTEIFGSKFLQLEKFGVVVPVEQTFN